MRHVDDAHHAKGDRQADRSEQQHAAEADALEQIGGDADQPQPVVDRGEGRVGSLFQFGIGVRSGTKLVEQVLDLRVGGAAEGADGGEALLFAA